MKVFFALIVFFIYIKLEAGTIIQIKDFLCGCDHCDTVSTGEPLDIGRHMIMCHSWRKGMQKTMEVMRQTQKPEVEVKEIGDPKESKIIKDQPDENINIYNDYKWRDDPIHGWAYATTHQVISSEDMWLYRRDLGWVWTFGEERKFLYSEDYGWIYNIIYKSKRVLYFYDKRIWLLASRIKQKDLK